MGKNVISDDEEEGQNEYEQDNFIVDDVDEEQRGEEEEKAHSDEERQKKKKNRNQREVEDLDEDDYEMLRDNNAFHRRPKDNKKFKRLKKPQKNSDDFVNSPGARHMAAVEISCEPSVRKHVRSAYMDHATVSTVPTAEGRVAIDAFHQFACVKWLLNKPIREFNDEQWLLIQMAEEEKLLQVTLKLPEETMTSLMNEIKKYYLSPGVSKSAPLWNEQRELILLDAFHSFLLPSMEKEARALLRSKAKTWVLWEYGKAFWDKISVRPFKRRDNGITSDDEAAPRVMACCWSPGKPATTFVMLDSSGEVLDILYAGALALRSQNVNDQQRKKNDQQRLLKFMMDHQPHVVVLGAANLACTRLKTDIYEIIFKMVEDHPREVGNEMSEIIVYGDESLPRLYENSSISSDQFPAQPGIVKRAVALGRYLHNPLAMVASLCGRFYLGSLALWNIFSQLTTSIR